MAKKLDIAARLEELGCDPVEGLVRTLAQADLNGQTQLATKIRLELIQYLTPKLKAVEHSIEPSTMDFLDRHQRLARIRELTQQIGLKSDDIIEGELLHTPDAP